MEKHVRILGWLQIVMGLFDLFIGLLAFGLLSGIGLLSGDPTAAGAMTFIGGIIGTLALVLALPNLLVGLGLLLDWGGWVIALAVVLGFFNLAKFPWGTAVAVYTFWIAWRLYDAPEAG